ncbi:heat shock protein GrpE [Anatilimnocola aggregata]|uniref:Protein GrpE n=1 Tax=Anatilimnocola aggregata TaxID=2528021 RepID=A0A517YHG2_9BACT|nr:nucleotide exchange factor GrpE [Anatilimnocola aggregata]QDU29654.1 heat shock protein GrpE [Anatilimnocola aggregata]
MSAETEKPTTDSSEDTVHNPLFSSGPEAKIDQLQAELKKAQDELLRQQAEFENFRKRKAREMEEERKYTILPFARDLLPVVDNLERALDAAAQSGDTTSLRDGVKMVSAQLMNVLAQHHCERIPGVGAEFDPNYHQAIAQEATSEYAAGTVSREAQVGYKLYDRVVRPAQVFVSTGPAS